MVAKPNTAQRILDLAEKLVQTRGYNGFSYADIASALRVTKASLHYHYPSKAELGARLIERYDENFRRYLAEIDAANAPDDQKLVRFVDLYARTLNSNRVCLCGILAAEQATLPRPMRSALLRFFEFTETWLTELIERGGASGAMRSVASARDEAISTIALLNGAMLIARARGDVVTFTRATTRLLLGLGINA